MRTGQGICHLYTLSYPFGHGESFIEDELPYLLEAFEEVRIFPMHRNKDGLRPLPARACVVSLDDLGRFSAPHIERFRFALPMLKYEAYRKNIREEWAHIGRMIQLSKALEEFLSHRPAMTHYSYWTSDWAIVLGITRQREAIKRSVSRAHGFDLYDKRHPLGFQSYRRLQTHGQHRVFSISELGMKELESQYQDADIALARLGTPDHGLAPIPEDDSSLNIVSCSSVIPLKRVELIAKMVSRIPQAHWTHIGGGEGLEGLKERVKDLGISDRTSLLGQLDKEKVVDLYLERPFHFFVHMSESEEVPVSMMEAMSFGIPVFACDVGGVGEIVDSMSGLLWPVDVSVDNCLERIKEARPRLFNMRNGARKRWQQDYNAAKNYRSFAGSLHPRLEQAQ